MGQTVACANQKGGVGKTTTVVNLATYLALAGDRVLVVDLDPQGNATSGLGIERSALERSIYEALLDGVPVHDLVVRGPVDRLEVVPSALPLAGAEVELAGVERRERRLADALSPLDGRYQYVFIDCPPSLGLLTINALTAADSVLVPIQCEYYALEGLSQLVATVNLVREHLNPNLELKGVVMTMFDARTNLASEVVAEVRRHLGPAVLSTIVPRSVRLAEAPSHGVPIALYRPESAGAEAYRRLAVELRARDGRPLQATESAPPLPLADATIGGEVRGGRNESMIAASPGRSVPVQAGDR